MESKALDWTRESQKECLGLEEQAGNPRLSIGGDGLKRSVLD